jgi:hypothetical protein
VSSVESQRHPVQALWARHHPPDGYPTGVLAVREPIPGIAFFPGGYGLWRHDTSRPLPPMPIGGIMVLGHDFHSECGYEASLARGRESASQPTWRQLRNLFDVVGIDPSQCFFTNIYMGLRAGVATTGPFPGRKDQRFVEHCRRFLAEQLRVQRPSLILTLGIYVPSFLGLLSSDLSVWTQGAGLKYLDRVGPVRTGVRFELEPTLVATVVALTHPSLRDASVRHRRYGGREGNAAELEMLREALGLPFDSVARRQLGSMPGVECAYPAYSEVV